MKTLRRVSNRKNTKGRYTQYVKCADGSTKCIKHWVYLRY